MSDSYSVNFELPTLLKNGDLEIKALASKNSALTVGNFFISLSKFTNQAPFVAEALARVVAHNSDRSDYKLLGDFKLLLDEVGCKKFVPFFNDIVEECRRGNKPFAASCAKQISNDFNSVIQRVAAAKKQPKTESLHQIVDLAETEPAGADLTSANESLKLVLDRLDKSEATRKLRILVVDDAPIILKTISGILSEEYKVYGMTNPTLMEKFLHQITPDLFFLDYKMPELNGFELIPIIRSFKEHKDTPIIFLTSVGTIDHVSAAITLGACDFLVKPVQPKLIMEKVAKHIVRKKLF